jgi:hypothetical protein
MRGIFERRNYGQAELDEAQLIRLAAHEGAHALLGLIAMKRGCVRCMWISPRDQCGKVEWLDGREFDRLDTQTKALIMAAGAAGQDLAGCGRTGCHHDASDRAFKEASWEGSVLAAEAILLRHQPLFDRIRHELAKHRFVTGAELDGMWIDDVHARSRADTGLRYREWTMQRA